MIAKIVVAPLLGVFFLAGCSEMGTAPVISPPVDRPGRRAAHHRARGGEARARTRRSSPCTPRARRRAHGPGDRRHRLPPRAAAQRGRLSDRRGPGDRRHRPHGPFLYLVEPDGKATRYGIAVGREGFGWNGTGTIARRAKWPRWTPPPEMIARDPHLAKWKDGQPGGVTNPLGARALYIYFGGHDFGLPHPRHQHPEDHRLGGLLGLLPDAEPGRHRPLRPRPHGRQGRRPLTGRCQFRLNRALAANRRTCPWRGTASRRFVGWSA